MLRLVHPAEKGQDPPASKGRRSAALSLTVEETRHFRAALQNIGRAYGGLPVLAGVIGVPVSLLYQSLNKSRKASPALALRVAKAAGMHVEALIGPALSEAGRCGTCGARAGHAERRAS